jgi:hypothetical protein
VLIKFAVEMTGGKKKIGVLVILARKTCKWQKDI